MKKTLLLLTFTSLIFSSCNNNDDDDVTPQTEAPATYLFERSGTSTVDYNGQTTRILMGNEFVSALKSPTNTLADLNGMFAHTAGGNNFSDADLNASSKSLRSKVAASTDFFSSNTTDAIAIKAQFDGWIADQVNEVFPNWNVNATAGVAGQIQEAGGGSTRYVNDKGIELNQIINKGLIGGLMIDQMLNNYLSPAVLDASTNVSDNDNDVLATDKNYTNMEHKWDEAFGYLYGADNALSPVLNQDSFLNKYLSRVEGDPDFTGIAADVYDALKLGRAAITAKDYLVRDEQAEIIREKISTIVAIRVVYYLQQAKTNLSDKASAFHDLSEGIGFIYSLQFTRKPNSIDPYFTKSEVDGFLATLMSGNGFWDVTETTLDQMSDTVSAKFSFTVSQAGS